MEWSHFELDVAGCDGLIGLRFWQKMEALSLKSCNWGLVSCLGGFVVLLVLRFAFTHCFFFIVRTEISLFLWKIFAFTHYTCSMTVGAGFLHLHVYHILDMQVGCRYSVWHSCGVTKEVPGETSVGDVVGPYWVCGSCSSSSGCTVGHSGRSSKQRRGDFQGE